MGLHPYWREPAPLEGETRVLASRRDERGLWVRLAEGLFYPESGGQPADTGSLGGRRVLDVQEMEGERWHLLDGEPEEGALRQAVDPQRRRDHMEQHSGQHLLSAVCIELLGAATLSFHLGETISTVELDRGELDDAALERVQARCWELIREDRPIRILYPDAAEAAALPLRKAPTVQEGLRVVVIEGYDWSPCGGTHLASTGRIGALLLGRREKIRGRWRVEFLAGRRALLSASAGLAALRRLAEAATCAPVELEGKLAAQREETARLRKELQRARELLLAQEAAALVEDTAWEALPAGGRLLMKDFGPRPPAELAQLARLLCETPDRCLLWACRDEGRPRFHFQRSRGEGAHLGELLGRLLGERGGKGGGGPDRALGGLESGDPGALLDQARRQLIPL